MGGGGRGDVSRKEKGVERTEGIYPQVAVKELPTGKMKSQGNEWIWGERGRE